MHVMRALLDKVEPTLGAEEEPYRLHFFPADKTQAASSALIALALFVLVFALELNFVDHRQLLLIVVTRLAFVALSVALLVASRGMVSPAALDRATLIWTVGLAAQSVVLTALRPASTVDSVVIVVTGLAVYALAPTPLLMRAAPPILLSFGFLAVLWLVRHTPFRFLWPTAGALTAMNALGIWASSRLHTRRRQQYQSQEKLRASLQERDVLIDRLRQSHKMEAMGRIVGGVAHDFNNLLGTMLTSVDFLLGQLPGASASRADAETIRAAVQRSAELTQQLLAFSRQQVLAPKVVNLNELASDTERMLVRTIGENIAIDVSLGEKLSAVRVDPGQIQQILMNLSVNARDAMPTGGTLAIRTRNAMLGERTPMAHSEAVAGAYVVLTVSDTGTGMDAATLAQIFEPFFTTKPPGRGTGLGLSTVFGIVEQSGGHMRVKSTPGYGTMFEIFLPAVSERPERPDKVREEPPPRGSETILLAEDDEELRKQTARVLTAHGYRVLQASDGVEALRVAEQHHGTLDLLTTDVVMPSMGGPELARELSAKHPGLRVLYVSGYIGDAAGLSELGSGNAFLQKPVDPKTLARKVRQVLDEPLRRERQVGSVDIPGP